MSFASIWGLITSLPALIKLVGQFFSLINDVRRAFQKDPVKEIAKDEEAQKEAQKRAEESDDTSGTFGGESK